MTKRLTLSIGVAAMLVGAAAAPSAGAQSRVRDAPGAFEAAILGPTNRARMRVGAPPLDWSPRLAGEAQAYARRLAARNRFEHDPNRNGGENLWMGTTGAFAVEEMVGHWIAERRDYVPGVFPDVTRTRSWADVGHYTQIIWPDTREVGCALARNARDDFLVCRYLPAGNVMGVRLRR